MQQLEMEQQQVMTDLQMRQAAAIQQMYDSLEMATQRFNQTRNASFIISYQTGTPFVILADPAKDITQEILFDLNKSLNIEK